MELKCLGEQEARNLFKDGYKKKGKVLKMVNEFIKSDVAIAEITDYMNNYSNITSAQGAFAMTIKRSGVEPIKARVIKGHLYLIKELEFEKEMKNNE